MMMIASNGEKSRSSNLSCYAYGKEVDSIVSALTKTSCPLKTAQALVKSDKSSFALNLASSVVYLHNAEAKPKANTSQVEVDDNKLHSVPTRNVPSTNLDNKSICEAHDCDRCYSDSNDTCPFKIMLSMAREANSFDYKSEATRIPSRGSTSQDTRRQNFMPRSSDPEDIASQTSSSTLDCITQNNIDRFFKSQEISSYDTQQRRRLRLEDKYLKTHHQKGERMDNPLPCLNSDRDFKRLYSEKKQDFNNRSKSLVSSCDQDCAMKQITIKIPDLYSSLNLYFPRYITYDDKSRNMKGDKRHEYLARLKHSTTKRKELRTISRAQYRVDCRVRLMGKQANAACLRHERFLMQQKKIRLNFNVQTMTTNYDKNFQGIRKKIPNISIEEDTLSTHQSSKSRIKVLENWAISN